jgi:PAS domain S-box-containing protein
LINNLGFSRWEDVQGKDFQNITDPKSGQAIIEKFRALFEEQQPFEPFEYNYRTKDEKVLIGETTVSPIVHNGNVIGARGLIRDITARVKAEREILEQKDLLDSLLQQSPIAMVINDMDKKISVVNPAFEKMFGYSRDEAVGKSLDRFNAGHAEGSFTGWQTQTEGWFPRGCGNDLCTFLCRRTTIWLSGFL